MRIGLFTDTYTPDINGVVSSIVTLQRQLEKHGHEVYVIANHKGSKAVWEGNVLRLPGMELKKLYGYKFSTPYQFAARDMLKNLKLDVIHAHTEMGIGIFAHMFSKHMGIPLVSTYHTMYEDYTHYVNLLHSQEIDKVAKKIVGSLSRVVGESSQAVIAPSEKTKEVLTRYGVKTPIYVVPTGLELDLFRPEQIDPAQVAAIRQQYAITKEDRIVVFLGRVAKEKSIDIPLEGMRYVQNPHIRFMIVGDGPDLENLKKQAKAWELGDRVIFTGKKAREEVPCYYAAADCFVSASLTETQGMTYIEALASGLPVFARPDDVLEDLVEEGVSGYLFQTPQEYAAKLDAYFALEETKRRQMRQGCRAYVNKYDADIFYNKVLSVYYQAIEDYRDAYEVTKIRILDDAVKVTLENDSQEEAIRLYMTMEDYFLYKVRLHQLLDASMVQELQMQQDTIKGMCSAIRKLAGKDYSCAEMRDYLIHSRELSEADAEAVLADLKERGYLDDARFAREKAGYYSDLGYGQQKIRRTLLKKGVESDVVEAALGELPDEQEEEKARAMAQRLKASIRGKSKRMKRQAIISKLMTQGYSSEVAKRAGEDLDLNDEDEQDALDKTIQKALRLYASKLSGSRLRQKVQLYCLQKGFSGEMVRERLEEWEWNDDEQTVA